MSDETWVVTLPKLGESVTEGVIGTFFKNVGDEVEFDDPLFEVSTDKVDTEVPSSYDGVVLEVLAQEGDTVSVGAAIMRIGGKGATVPNRLPSAAHGVAAAGGRSLNDPSAPSVGGSEGPTTEDADFSPSATGEVFEITMPKLGESVTEGTIGTWFKAVGDDVAFDDPLFDVSTDKVDSEIPSPYDGKMLDILVNEGETVPVGTVLARIGAAGSQVVGPAGNGSGPAAVETPRAVNAQTGAPPVSRDGAGGRLLSPLVRRLAAEHGIDVTTVAGTGVGGRIRREDITNAIATGPTAVAAPAATAAPVAATTPTAAAPRASKAGTDGRDEVVPLSRMRLILADTLKASQTLAASVWTSVEVDFDNVERMRTEYKARFKKETGASLSYLPFISRAVCDALRVFPTVNSSIDLESKTMTLHPYVNLGVAVDLDEQGLVVPVVKDADSLNIRGIASQIATKAAAARAKELPNKEMQGSTFTITNPGPYASYASSPIINQPNVAILCTDGVKRRPVAVGDAIAIHPVGIIGMVYDHRAFDGSTASKFLLHIRDSLEQRDWSAELS
ncbi:2-oxoglutarate dehydrogenase, E2 component, dihydrolipoamide succinyltransferase [Mycobacterium sp.]|jgi:pyruvate dehydrogenase E2 component (dihydrolipoamide acetyltransferase)|uniref:2-oxoglutarate dehydrogenase, E2 component, dihydrolipoamide succinyltransferase n=1 Tax=Mycobacterium sp. TaxID=1785 RepID=UPI002B880D43|nr:2-oxoglutarate dehydrogenase, E2 component, dihydrolipoamide succinyltransferase [Mycobacterium sp.]HTH89279.1 2-oxoglutarate dehydrogenase, E2 component, dihydrolipoamide succinyltransferase [Mycobacterium sp.]